MVRLSLILVLCMLSALQITEAKKLQTDETATETKISLGELARERLPKIKENRTSFLPHEPRTLRNSFLPHEPRTLARSTKSIGCRPTNVKVNPGDVITFTKSGRTRKCALTFYSLIETQVSIRCTFPGYGKSKGNFVKIGGTKYAVLIPEKEIVKTVLSQLNFVYKASNGANSVSCTFVVTESKCGQANSAMEGRIVGGSETAPNEYPWTALVRAGPHECAGTLIAPNWVLTAAHCTHLKTNSEVVVTLGVHNKEEETGQMILVSEIIEHEDYSDFTLEYDIALLRLLKIPDFSSTVRSVCLPNADDTSMYTAGIVTGWGATAYRGPGSDVLLQVEIPIVTTQTCYDVYGYSIDYSPVICAGAEAGGLDSCQGDSGGAMLSNEFALEGEYTQIGIVSYGYDCAKPLIPGVYTKVSDYRDWIDGHIAPEIED